MMQKKIYLFFLFFPGLAFILVECTSSGYTASQVVEILKTSNDEEMNNFCEGSGCCRTNTGCLRTCQKIFRDHSEKIGYKKNFTRERNICRGLSRQMVRKLDGLNSLLRNPTRRELRRVNIHEEFKLYLAIGGIASLGYIIYKYGGKDQARELLYWIAENEDVAKEVKQIQGHQRMIQDLIAAFGGKRQDRGGGPAIEFGLAKGLFKVMDENGNQTLINITHNIIRQTVCNGDSLDEDRVNLCVLRVYCKERTNQDGVYVHSEDLRNNIIREVDDESLNDFIYDEVLLVGYDRGTEASEISNQVCDDVCEDSDRGCEWAS